MILGIIHNPHVRKKSYDCIIFVAHVGEPRWVIGVGVAAVLVLLIIALAVLTISVICIKR